MLLIEADGKALFRAFGIAVPIGVTVGVGPVPALPGVGPWMVKAQVPVGGRGKAGGIFSCATRTEVAAALEKMLGTRLKGHAVESCLVEQATGGAERYLSLSIDAASYGVRVIYLAGGGVDVERAVETGGAGVVCAPDVAAIETTLENILAGDPDRDAILAVGRKLGKLFLGRELMLAEINPLFVGPAGCVAADAKLVIDLNAIERQPEISEMLEARPEVYADALRKMHEGFDYVELDPEGEIGLLTTGAGLSMMLIDEMTSRGGKPLNFLDIRTGQLRGDPRRIVRALGWMAERPSLRVVLVNIFAGITDLAEFANLLVDALALTPTLKVPVVARLVGRGSEDARKILAERRPDIPVMEELPAALDRVAAVIGARA
jgi:succinyl-CoA synthetase beta subunit